jgi:alpha-glucosidase
MQWDPSRNAGFSDKRVADLWLPLAPDYHDVNVAKELSDPYSVLSLYRRLLKVRKDNPALYAGSYQSVDGVPAKSFVYLRQMNSKRFLVVLNSSPEPVHFSLPALGKGRVVVSTGLKRENEAVVLADLSLAGKEGLLIELE